jgi:hypothetical protein
MRSLCAPSSSELRKILDPLKLRHAKATVVAILSRWPAVSPSSASIITAASGIASPMAAQFLKPSETPSDFSPIRIGVVLNLVPKPSSRLPWWAMREPGECGEIGSSLLPFLFRLNDRRRRRLALQPFGKVRVSSVLALGGNQIRVVVLQRPYNQSGFVIR